MGRIVDRETPPRRPRGGESGTQERSQRLLTARQAAAYLGYVGTDILDVLPVNPIYLRLTGSPRWDKKALDQLLDRLSELDQPIPTSADRSEAEAALQAWRARRGPRSG